MSFDTVMPPYNASDASATFLNASCFDFLLIEIVPLAYRVANDLEAKAAEAAPPRTPGATPQAVAGPAGAANTADAPGAPSIAANGATGSVAATAGAASIGSGIAGTNRLLDEEEERDAVYFRLEGLGYRVGQGLVERFSKDRPRFGDTLDVIKFLCKDLWMLVFRKQVDNLKTNHRGVYVLTDNAFRPFSRMSTEAGGQAVVRAQPFLWFPAGILRGALAAMGVDATVQAETSDLPGAIFQIKTMSGRHETT